MAVKMRLQRFGKKGQPFYHIVIADGRAPRDGRFIEKIGTYNPLPNPAEIAIDMDKAIQWLQNGAQPSDTVNAILSYKGILYKNHLLKGVAKGALTLEQADEKFETWMKDKEQRITSKLNAKEQKKRADQRERLEAEKKVNEARQAEITRKRVAEAAANNPAPAAVEEEVAPAEEAVSAEEAPAAE
ncbi:MAG TPA: 30S ribosomal protein S16 [Bacteroidales bacterium]|nr:MAG: 30S ribosomal protein S16 [Bacteroidetes bacterium GWE2_42_24]OFY29366.1 MAG: 30S ribosomal protein S16 [Bacteroidetes bacterium GWF2_43_11]HAQ65497.1 30S ribosomal protein S16 [Bacteroidales bacterium]HBZ67268.1 30S ribosomal protein S16 [Bacteroidales bacterium]